MHNNIDAELADSFYTLVMVTVAGQCVIDCNVCHNGRSMAINALNDATRRFFMRTLLLPVAGHWSVSRLDDEYPRAGVFAHRCQRAYCVRCVTLMLRSSCCRAER